MPSPSVDVRPATAADIDALARLYRAAYDTLGDLGFPSSMQTEDGTRLRAWLDSRELFVADATTAAAADVEAPGGLVGAVHLVPRADWPCPELGRLAVHPAHQRAGIGTVLREHVEAAARERGHHRIRLRTFTGHPFLREWYEAAGYTVVDHQALDTPDYDLHVMEKPL